MSNVQVAENESDDQLNTPTDEVNVDDESVDIPSTSTMVENDEASSTTQTNEETNNLTDEIPSLDDETDEISSLDDEADEISNLDDEADEIPSLDDELVEDIDDASLTPATGQKSNGDDNDDEIDTAALSNEPIEIENALPDQLEILRKVEDQQNEDTIEEQQAKKVDTAHGPIITEVDAMQQERVKTLFVYPHDYKNKLFEEFYNSPLFVIHGRQDSGKMFCAIHLGLVLLGKVTPAKENVSFIDYLDSYLDKSQYLLKQTPRNHTLYNTVLTQNNLLRENITQVKEIDDTNDLKVERQRCISRLERASLEILGLSFHHLNEDTVTSSQIPLKQKLCIYKSNKDRATLLDFTQQEDIDSNNIYIIEDISGEAATVAGLSETMINEFREKEIVVIITIDDTSIDVAALPSDVFLISAHTDDPDQHAQFMQKLFKTYRDYYQASLPENVFSLMEKKAGELSRDYFTKPFQVASFYDRIIDVAYDIKNEEKLLEFAAKIGKPRQSLTRDWFTKLSYNEKLYALLISLLEQLPRLYLEEIYNLAVIELREKGISNLADPRETGLDDLLRKVNASETTNGSIRFIAPAFKQEVQSQIRNHHYLLWSLLETLIGLVGMFKHREYWQLRQALGFAIGRLSVNHFDKLRPILEGLAYNQDGGVVAVVGSALDQFGRNSTKSQASVHELLTDWAASGNPDLLWAVGATVWRIYDNIAASDETNSLNKTHEIFSTLVEEYDRFKQYIIEKEIEDATKSFAEQSNNVRLIETQVAAKVMLKLEIWRVNNRASILHAIRQISVNNCKNIVDLIKDDWLQAEQGSNKQIVGILAGRQLLKENSKSEKYLTIERHHHLLELIYPLLSTEESDAEKINTVNIIIESLLVWLKNPDWVEQVYTKLLHVINRITAGKAAYLRTSIVEYWLDSDIPKAQEIGQSLIARSFAIHGLPMDIPNYRFGIIALDASRLANINHNNARLGLELYRLLNVRLDIVVTFMGTYQMLASDEPFLIQSDLQAKYDYPPLLYPALTNIDVSKAYFVLVITWGTIIDLEDILPEPWRDRVIIADLAQNKTWPETIQTITLPSKDTPEVQIVREINTHFARSLAHIEASEWWLMLKPYFAQELPEIDGVVSQLEQWITNLDKIEYSKHPDDVTRTIICAILLLAKVNLTYCVDQIKTWLTFETEQENEAELFHLIGQATGKLLYRIYGVADPIPSVTTHECLLSLVYLLAEQSWDGAKVVLKASQRWITQADWLERLEAHPSGEASELTKLIDQTTIEYETELREFLNDWEEDISSVAEDEIPQQQLNLVKKLQLRLALGGDKILPDLPEGHNYGLIVVDTSLQKRNLYKDLVKLAVNVIKTVNKKEQEDLHLLIHRLGQTQLIAGPGEKPTTRQLGMDNSYHPARLISPILERHLAETVSFVLVFSSQSLLDEEDWYESEWHSKIHFYTHTSRFKKEQGFSFNIIPVQSKLKNAQEVIIDHLFQN